MASLAVTAVVAASTKSRLVVVGVVMATAVSILSREVSSIGTVGAIVEAALSMSAELVVAVWRATSVVAACATMALVNAVGMAVVCGGVRVTARTTRWRMARLSPPPRGLVGSWRRGRVAVARRLPPPRPPLMVRMSPVGVREMLLWCLVSVDRPRERNCRRRLGRTVRVRLLPPLEPARAERVQPLGALGDLMRCLVSVHRWGTSWARAACVERPWAWRLHHKRA